MPNYSHTFALLTLLLISFAPKLIAQNTPMQAELRVGGVLDVEVEEVTAWGFWLDTGQGLLFRQLTHITTPSESLAQRIVSFIPDAIVEPDGTFFIVRLAHLTFPSRTPKDRSVSQELNVLAGSSVGSRVGLETAFQVHTRYTGPLLFHFGNNIGWSFTGGGYLGGLTFGAGVDVPLGAFRFTLIANAWKRYLQDENERLEVNKSTVAHGNPDAYSVALFSERAFDTFPFTVHFGVRYFIEDIKLKESEFPLGIVIVLSKSL